MSILTTALLAVWALIAVVMILVILMQRPKSEGLGAAFGGGVTENIFGAQTTNVLVKFTSYLSAFFFLITFVLSILYAHQNSNKSVLREELLKGQPTSASSRQRPRNPRRRAQRHPLQAQFPLQASPRHRQQAQPHRLLRRSRRSCQRIESRDLTASRACPRAGIHNCRWNAGISNPRPRTSSHSFPS